MNQKLKVFKGPIIFNKLFCDAVIAINSKAKLKLALNLSVKKLNLWKITKNPVECKVARSNPGVLYGCLEGYEPFKVTNFTTTTRRIDE
jgi:hypothetical protein